VERRMHLKKKALMPFRKMIPTGTPSLKHLVSGATEMVWAEARVVRMEVPIWEGAVIIKNNEYGKEQQQ
jgi:hypothetical protein